MSPGESVTQWIYQLKEGDRAAVQKLWEDYFPRLVRQAQLWLRRTSVKVVDAEDIALSAFKSFCLRAEQGCFPKLFDRGDLWQLLVVIAFRKACNQVKHEARRQPLNGRVQHASALSAANGEDAGTIFTRLISSEPDPKFAAQTAEEYRRLLARLDDEQLRHIAEMKMAGYTNAEIGQRLKPPRAVVTIERKLARIRRIWEEEVRS
ncbi:MAG TPA: ECF-type sigma factor [Gemmataceae bacterium]|jgi:DNA-directed RNA polymerase specialized sigma24 family protein